MQRFKFRLQSVLDLRKHTEKEHKDRLYRERRVINALEAEGARLSEKMTLWSRRYLSREEEGMRPVEDGRMNCYLTEIDRLLLDNRQRQKQQAMAVEAERLVLIEKMREKKTVEALYKRQSTRFEAAEQKKEEMTVEELILGRLHYSRAQG